MNFVCNIFIQSYIMREKKFPSRRHFYAQLRAFYRLLYGLFITGRLNNFMRLRCRNYTINFFKQSHLEFNLRVRFC